MIQNILKLTSCNIINYGTRIHKLYNLVKNNVPIIDSFIISNEYFNIDGKKISILEKQLCESKEIEELQKYNSVSIYPSLFKEVHGIREQVNIVPEKDKIINSIQSIYNDWYDDKAKAYRITHSLNESETFPAILIQANISPIETIVTHSPKTGKMTSIDNLFSNVHNTINIIYSKHILLINSIIATFKTPCKIHFTEQQNKIKVSNIENEKMALDAKGIALLDLYEKKS